MHNGYQIVANDANVKRNLLKSRVFSLELSFGLNNSVPTKQIDRWKSTYMKTEYILRKPLIEYDIFCYIK